VEPLPPFGRDAVDGRLEADPSEQETLARISELHASGLGYLKIARALNDAQRATKRGRAWQAARVRSVLGSNERLAV
jgi:hypothetical protein